MQLQQLPQRHALDRAEAFAVPVVEEILGIFRTEALNHTLRIERLALYVKQSQPLSPNPTPLRALLCTVIAPLHPAAPSRPRFANAISPPVQPRPMPLALQRVHARFL